MASRATPSRSAPTPSRSTPSGASGSSGRTRVGKYELGKTLGEGTFAKVKFARNVENGDNVAIKVIDKEKVLKNKMIAQVHPPAALLLKKSDFTQRCLTSISVFSL